MIKNNEFEKKTEEIKMKNEKEKKRKPSKKKCWGENQKNQRTFMGTFQKIVASSNFTLVERKKIRCDGTRWVCQLQSRRITGA